MDAIFAALIDFLGGVVTRAAEALLSMILQIGLIILAAAVLLHVVRKIFRALRFRANSGYRSRAQRSGAYQGGAASCDDFDDAEDADTGAAKRFSFVTTAMLDAAFDHETGKLSATVLSGASKGRALDDLQLPQLLDLLDEAQTLDPESIALVETYLNRRFSGWRQAEKPETPEARASSRLAGALRLFELTPRQAADRETVKKRHRDLVRRNHPDTGGSTVLVQQINEAFEIIRNACGWSA